MVWNQEKEVLLCREVLLVEPHRFKEKTRERSQCWQSICNNLLKLPGFNALTTRGVREKTTNLIERFRRIERDDIASTGTSREIDELDVLLEEIIAKVEEFKNSYDDSNKKKDKDKVLGEEVRQMALETYSETRKRSKENNDGNTTSSKRRSSGDSTITYLVQKMQGDQQLREKELALEKERFEFGKQKHENQQNMMLIMFSQQQQQTDELTKALINVCNKNK